MSESKKKIFNKKRLLVLIVFLALTTVLSIVLNNRSVENTNVTGTKIELNADPRIPVTFTNKKFEQLVLNALRKRTGSIFRYTGTTKALTDNVIYQDELDRVTEITMRVPRTGVEATQAGAEAHPHYIGPDTSDLRYFKNLTKLNADSIGIEDVGFLREMPRITELRLPGNNVSDISPMADLQNLSVLTIDSNRLTSIEALRGKTFSQIVLGNHWFNYNIADNRFGKNVIRDLSPLPDNYTNLVDNAQLVSLDIRRGRVVSDLINVDGRVLNLAEVFPQYFEPVDGVPNTYRQKAIVSVIPSNINTNQTPNTIRAKLNDLQISDTTNILYTGAWIIKFNITNDIEKKQFEYSIPINGGAKNNIPQSVAILINNDKGLPTKTVNAVLNAEKTMYVVNPADLVLDKTDNNFDEVRYTFTPQTQIPNYPLTNNNSEYRYVSPIINKEIVVNKINGRSLNLRFRIKQNGVNFVPDKNVIVSTINPRNTAEFIGLTETDFNGVPNQFTTESLVAALPAGYTLTKNSEFEYTIEYTSPKISQNIRVTRVGGKPQNVEIRLTSNKDNLGYVIQNPVLTIDTTNNVTIGTWTNLDRTMPDVSFITYRTEGVTNNLPEGYSLRKITEFDYELRYTPPTTKSFVIEKRWQGGSTLIPDTIDVKIKRRVVNTNNYEDVKTVTLRKDNNWQLAVSNLETTNYNADIYEYAIEEITNIANFTGNVNNFEITNTYTSPTTNITKNINVIGGGNNNPTVKVRLIGNQNVLNNTEQIVNLNNLQNVTFNNMPTTDSEGRIIDYKLDIVEVTNNPNEANGTYTINDETVTNAEVIFLPKKIEVNGSVQLINARALWQNIEVALFKNGQIVENTNKIIAVNEFLAIADNKKLVSYDNLDKVTENNELINYEIRALTDLEKFNKTTNTNNNSFNTIYTYNNETTNVEYKILVNNGPNIAPSITVNLKDNNNIIDTQVVGNTEVKFILQEFENKPLLDMVTGSTKNYIVDIVVPENYRLVTGSNNQFIIEFVSPKTTFTATKEWENGPSVKPEVTFNLYRDGQKVEGQSKVVPRGTNTVTWDNLDQTDINANIYTYSVEEESILGYEKVIVDNNTIKNSYKVDETGVYSKNITVIGGPSIKPTVTIKLKKNTNVIEPNITKTVNTNNENRFEFTNLPKTDILGNENTYDVEIENIENYVISRDITGNITLTYVSPTDEIIVNKVFVGGNSNTRPTITLQVKKNDQVVEEKVAVNTGDNINYRATFNLPRTENDGSQIIYTVDEKVVPANFVKSITGMIVTNTYESPKTQISKQITRENGKPIPVTVYLTRNGVKVPGTDKTIQSGDTVSYDNLDLTDNSENRYNYEIVVDKTNTNLPNGYSYINEVNPTGIKYTPINGKYTTIIPVNGGDKNLLPNTINVDLVRYQNYQEEVLRKQVVATLNDTKTAYVVNEIVQLTKLNAGKYAYEVEPKTQLNNYILENIADETVPSYDLDNFPDTKPTYFVYNYKSPEVSITKPVIKEGGKPQLVKVVLTRDGIPVENKEIIINSGENATFSNLPKTDENGRIYNYDIKVLEDPNNLLPTGYTIEDNKVVYRSEKTVITIEKIWEGGSELIPDSIEVKIKIKKKTEDQRDYTDVKTVVIRREDNWKLNVDDLDKTDEHGNEYIYVIEELTNVEGFTGTINNFKITGKYVSPTTTVRKSVDVIGGGLNKPTVKVRLKQNGQVLSDTEKIINLNDSLNIIWENMKATDNEGRVNKYDIEIVEVTNNPNEDNGTYTINENRLTFVPKKISLNASVQYVNGRNLFEDIQVALFKNGQIVTNTTRTITVSEITANTDNKKEFTIDNLDKVTINNELINYEIKALTDVDKFNKTTNTNNNSFNTIYTHENETQNIEFKVNIVNGPLNSPNVAVNLKENNNVIDTQNVGNTTSKEITSLFTNKEVRELQSGDTKNYTVDIVVPENYRLVNRQGNEFTIEYVSPKTTFTATKEWENGPSVKPEVTFNLYRDGQKVEGQSKVVPRGTNTVTWDNLDKTDINANVYTYSVEEESILGYEKVIVDNNTIKNSYKVDETGVYSKNITVIGGPSIKPTVTIKLKKNTNVIEPNITKTVNTNNENRFEFTNLPKTDILGNENTYDVEIENVENYVISRDTTGNITLTYVSPTDEIVVNKMFVGGNSNTRPSITLQVKKNDQVIEEKVAVNTGDNINYRATFNLPRTENDGSQITYTVDEKVVPANFVKSITGMTVTNTYVSPKTEVSYKVVRNNGENIDLPVYLIKNDNKVDGTNKNINTNNVEYNNLDLTDNEENVYNYKVGVNENELPNGYTAVVNHNTKTITVNYVSPEKLIDVNIPVNNGNKDLIPNTIEVSITNDKNLPNKTVTATLNDTKTAYVINDVSVDLTNNNAETVNYTIKAVTPITNYVLNDTKTEYNYVSPKVNKEIVVNRVGGKEQTVEFRIRQNNEVLNPDSKVSIKATNTRTTNTFTNLDKTNIAGVDYTYTTESLTTLPNGYTIVKDSEFEYTIKYVSPQTKTITIDKVWNGGSTLIPDTIEVKIKRKTQKDINYKDVKTVLLRKDNNWQLVVNNLENTDENEEVYEYAIEEVTRISNFTGIVNNFEITNTYTSPEHTITKDIEVIGGGVNKPTVKVRLIRNNEVLTNTEKVIDLNNTNIAEFTNMLTTNNDGVNYDYKFEIVEVTNNPNEDNGTYTINENTLTFVPKKISLNASVQYVNGRNLFEDVQVALFKNGQIVPNTIRTITVSEITANTDNKKEFTIDNLDKVTINNELINYEIKALTDVDKFNKTTNTNNNSFNTIYTFANETKTVPYKITVINGAENTPEIEVILSGAKEDKQIVGNTTNKEINAEFVNLLSYNELSGIENAYNVDIVVPENYRLVNRQGNEFTIEYVSPKTTFTATKEWENGPSVKPEVTFNLYRDGQKVEGQSKVVPRGTNTVTWDNLDKTDIKGNDYTYSVEEESILGYEKVIVDNNTIKNSYKVDETGVYSKNITVIGGPSIKPTVTIKLKKNTNVIEPNITKTVNTNNENRFEFTNLPKTDILGNENTYDVEIENVENYVISRDTNGNITLTYVSPTDEIIVNKVFVGGNINTRPTITLQVKKNNQVVEEKVAVNIGDNINYRATFNVPRTENDGSQITYTVDEKVVPVNFVKSITGMTVTNTYVSPKTEVSYKVVRNNGENIDVPVYLIKNDNKVDGTNKNINTNNVEYNNLDLTDNEENVYNYKIGVNENELPNGYTAVVNHNTKTIAVNYVSPEKLIDVNIPVNNGNKDLIPNTIEVSITNDKNLPNKTITATLNDTKTSYVINDVSVDLTNNNGETVNYIIKAVTPITNYVLNDTKTEYNYVSPKVNKEIVVNRVGGKEQTVEFRIRQNNEVLNPDSKVSIKATNTRTTNTFTNLDKTNIAGVDYTYTTESLTTLPNGYTIVKDSEFEYTIKYVSPQTKTITIDKVWNGGSTLIPDTIEVKIKRKTQKDINYKDVKTVLLRKDNNWQLVVNNLENTDENEEIYEYAIEEVTKISNFTGSVNNFEITNTYTSPEHTITKDIEVIGGGVNKPTVKVRLIRNNEVLTNTEKVIDLNNTNIAEFTNMLTTNNDGVNYNYKFEVVEVTNNPNEENGTYTINENTLTFVPKKIEINGSVKFIGAKTLWEDIPVILTKDNVVFNTSKLVLKTELNENGIKEITFTNLDKVTIDNEPIVYEITTNKNVEKFERTIENNNITYVYNNETKNIPVDIKVVGGKNIPQIPVKLVEKGTNKQVSEITLNNVNTGNFENVPVRDNVTGELKEYDVLITAPTNYVLTYENEKPVLTYVSPKTEFTANVEFVNGPSTKPNIELQLVRNGQAQDNTNKVLPNGVRTTIWNDLDLTNKDAEEYTYSVISLTEIENYTREYVENNTVRYTYVSPKVNKEFTITREGGKTVPVKVQLVKNGVPSTNTEDTKEVLRDKVTFTNLDKTDINGNENVYTLVVTNIPDNYTPIVDNNVNITIKYTSPKIDIDVNKVWVNGDTLVPNEIEVKLQRRVQGSDSEFTDVETFKVTKDSNWKKTIINLDKTDNNANNYEYKVVELTSIANFTGIVNNFEITNTYTSPKGNKGFNVSVVGKPIEVEVKLIDKVTNTDINTQTQTTSGGLVTFSDIDLTNTNGSIKEYTTDIVTNLNGRYSKVIDTNGNITLTYIPEKVDVTKNILIPEKLKENMPEIEVEIIRDGKPTGIRKVISTNEFNNLSNIDNKLFENTITENLDKTDINGNDYTYTIKLITNIPGYETNETNNNFEITKVVDKKDLVIDMKYVGGKVRKQAVVNILKDNVVIKTVKVNDTIEVKDLELNDKYENYYNYTIEVTNTEDFTKLNYKQEVNNLTIINTYESPRVDLPYKAIIPNNEKPVIKIQLFKNGEPVGEVIKLDGNYEYVFKDLDKTDINGNDYNYEIRIVEQDKDFEVHTNTNGSKMLVVKKNTNYLPFAGSENNVINIILPIALIIVFTIMNKNTVNSNKYNKTFRIRRQNRRNSSK